MHILDGHIINNLIFNDVQPVVLSWKRNLKIDLSLHLPTLMEIHRLWCNHGLTICNLIYFWFCLFLVLFVSLSSFFYINHIFNIDTMEASSTVLS